MCKTELRFIICNTNRQNFWNRRSVLSAFTDTPETVFLQSPGHSFCRDKRSAIWCSVKRIYRWTILSLLNLSLPQQRKELENVKKSRSMASRTFIIWFKRQTLRLLWKTDCNRFSHSMVKLNHPSCENGAWQGVIDTVIRWIFGQAAHNEGLHCLPSIIKRISFADAVPSLYLITMTTNHKCHGKSSSSSLSYAVLVPLCRTDICKIFSDFLVSLPSVHNSTQSIRDLATSILQMPEELMSFMPF